MSRVPSGPLFNTTGHELTKTNRASLRWTGTRWVYTRTVKGKKVTREVKKTKTPSPPKRKYTRKIGPRKERKFHGARTSYSNLKKRPFFKTVRGSFVVRSGGKSLYSRKARYYQAALISSLLNVPARIRPKRLPRK
jgi:hypothetical protein